MEAAQRELCYDQLMQRLLLLFILLVSLMVSVPASALDVTVKVSSVKMDFGLPYAPENLMDGDMSSAWVGGGIGPGVGQWIDLIFGMPVRVERIGIYNGHQGEGEFQNFRRIRAARIVYPDGVETKFWLRDEPGEQVVECRGRPFKSIRIVVDKVFPKGDVTAKKKLAVSEIKLYLSLMADPGDMGKDSVEELETLSAPPPIDPDSIVPDAIVELLKEFYVRQTSLADNYAELFAEDVQDRNDFQFEVFKEVQRQRGTYRLLRRATVDTSGLGFELVEQDGAFARVRVFGGYVIIVADQNHNVEEDSIFVVSQETDGWKIIELDGQESF